MIHMSNGQVIPVEDTVTIAATVKEILVNASTATTLNNLGGLGGLFPDGSSGPEFAAMLPEPSPQDVSNSIKPEVSKFKSTPSRAKSFLFFFLSIVKNRC